MYGVFETKVGRLGTKAGGVGIYCGRPASIRSESYSIRPAAAKPALMFFSVIACMWAV